jgi:hypothetical protein
MNRLKPTICTAILVMTISSTALAGTIIGARTSRTGTIIGGRTGTIMGGRTTTGTSTAPRVDAAETKSKILGLVSENIGGIVGLFFDGALF